MQTKIISQKKNPFLDREEFLMEVKSNDTPTYAQIKEELGKNKDLTVVNKIMTEFGTNRVVADVIVYNSKEAMKKNQVLPQKLRKKMEEERKAHEAAEKKAKAEAEKVIEEEKAVEEEKPTKASSASTPADTDVPQENLESEGKENKEGDNE